MRGEGPNSLGAIGCPKQTPFDPTTKAATTRNSLIATA
jgi:hypothetical protein